MGTIVKDYKELLESLSNEIDTSGLKIKYIADKLGIARSTFYKKKDEASWTVLEVEKLIELLRIK